MEIECEVKLAKWHFNHEKVVEHQTCFIDNKEFPKNEEAFILKRNQTDNITGLKVTNSLLFSIPKTIGAIFATIDVLAINNCGLKEISNKVLKYFPRLDFLDLSYNEIEFLPEDLFEGLEHLYYINISYNNLTMINPNIVKSFNPLICHLDLSYNPCVSVIYSFTRENRTQKLEELKNLFGIEYISRLEAKVQQLSSKQFEKVKNIEKSAEKAQNDEILSNTLEKIKPFLCDIENYLNNDDFKDFEIILDNETKIKIHKMIFIARSTVFAQIVKNNPDAEELRLKDIPEEIFNEVLKFIYTDIIPSKKEKFIEIYAVAEKLGIKSLKTAIEYEALKSVNDENAFDFLALAIKFKIENLKEKSLEKIQEIFPDMKFKKDLEAQCDQFRRIAEYRRALRKMMEEAQMVD